MKNKIQNKIISTSFLSLIIVGAVFYLIIIPQVQKIKETKSEIEKQRIDLEQKYLRGQNLKELSENIKKVEDKMELLENIYVKQEEALEFITTLENIAEKNQINQNIDLMAVLEKDKKSKDYQKKPVQILAEGEYYNLLKYLSDLESLKYQINIYGLEINKVSQKNTNNKDSKKIRMAIRTYVYWKN